MKDLFNYPTSMRILNYIKKYVEEHGYAPSYEEIMKSLDIKSKSTVSTHMNRLFEGGFLETDLDNWSYPRAYRVSGYKVIKEC